ncbi:ATP-binding protein [bacterium]|nr:ATP-binding protein [bacterium]
MPIDSYLYQMDTFTLASWIVLGFAYLVLALVLVYCLYHAWRNRHRHRLSATSETLLIRLPKDNEVKVEAAEQMFDALHALELLPWQSLIKRPPFFTIEVVAKKEDIAFYVTLPRELRDLIEKSIHAAYPEADITPVISPNIWTSNGQVAFTKLRATDDRMPIKTYKELANDGLQGLTSALSKMNTDEGAIVQFVIQPVGDRYRRQTIRRIEKRKDRQADSETQQPHSETESKEDQAMEAKVDKPIFKVIIRICVNSPDRFSAESILRNIVASFAQFDTPFTGLQRSIIAFKKRFMNDFVYRYPSFFGDRGMLTFNSEELATMIHFPNNTVETHHIRFLYAKNAPAPREIPESGLFLGKSIYRGDVRNIYMSLADRRRHMYIIGKTGTGKSEFLKEMILQDIEAGSGVCAIDPHGEFVEDILQMIPPERAEDVIYFNPSDLARPLGMNIMEADTEEQRQFVVGSVIGLMYKLYDPHHQGIIGPRFEHAIRNTMLTIMYRPGATFIELVRAITDSKFVEDILPEIEDPMVKRYWTDQMAQTSDFHKSEVLDYIVSKFGRFVTNKTMRNIIGQPVSAFNFRQAMDERKIILCNLSKGILGEEDAKFLGLILVPKVLTAAMSRQDIPMEQRQDFFLYVDEFQNYATEDFATILSEARKYRLNLVVANQFIAQIDDEIRNAVFGNVGTIVSFRVGVTDAQYLEHEFAPIFTETDLTNIEKYHVYVKTIVKNEPVPPFSMSLEKDMAEVQARMNPQLAAAIKQISRLKYGRDREEIEIEMNERARLL